MESCPHLDVSIRRHSCHIAVRRHDSELRGAGAFAGCLPNLVSAVGSQEPAFWRGSCRARGRSSARLRRRLPALAPRAFRIRHRWGGYIAHTGPVDTWLPRVSGEPTVRYLRGASPTRRFEPAGLPEGSREMGRSALKPRTIFMSGGRWRCTNVGSRTVVAIKLDQHGSGAINRPRARASGRTSCRPVPRARGLPWCLRTRTRCRSRSGGSAVLHGAASPCRSSRPGGTAR